ncbi:hypothetical protein [Blastopirellula marina]|uniref:hypothetical protein n=1 Tax=Blastopirellula marina TaxID=124 RepID=UPI0011AFFBB4|nr:hypothetical protein [Blastopirellula marina]
MTVVESPEAELAQQRQADIDDLIERIWKTKISLSASDAPLDEVMLQITKQLGCELWIDDYSLEAQGLVRDIPISIDVKNLAAGSVLKLVLRPIEITYVVQPNRLVVMTMDTADESQNFMSRFYPVNQWLGDGKRKLNLDKVRELVLMIEADTWEELGGPGSCEIYEDGLLISQPAMLHDRIRHVFSAMIKAQALPNDSYSVASISTHPLGEQADMLRRKIERQLISAQWVDVPLSDVALFLEKQLDIEVVIDQRELEEYGLDATKLVHGTWNQVTLATVLDDVLQGLELGWQISGDYLNITSMDAIEADLDVRVYPVRDLVPSVLLISGVDKLATYSGNGFCGVGGPNMPSVPKELMLRTPKEQLCEQIVWHVAADTWDVLGGPGNVMPCEASDSLIISQTKHGHQQIEALLQQLRQTKGIAAEEVYRQQASEVILMTYSIPSAGDKPRFSSMDVGLLAQRLTRDFAPDAWGEGRSIQALSDRIIIRQRRDIQRAIYQYLVEIGYFKSDRTETHAVAAGTTSADH